MGSRRTSQIVASRLRDLVAGSSFGPSAFNLADASVSVIPRRMPEYSCGDRIVPAMVNKLTASVGDLLAGGKSGSHSEVLYSPASGETGNPATKGGKGRLSPKGCTTGGRRRALSVMRPTSNMP